MGKDTYSYKFQMDFEWAGSNGSSRILFNIEVNLRRSGNEKPLHKTTLFHS